MFGRPPAAASADDRFDVEVLAMEELAIESFALPLDPIVMGDVERALRKLPRPQNRTWLYRGWMLREEEYTALYDAIADARRSSSSTRRASPRRPMRQTTCRSSARIQPPHVGPRVLTSPKHGTSRRRSVRRRGS
jgi:hypothetical protein